MRLLYLALFLGYTASFGQNTYQLRGRITGVRPNEKLLLKKQDNLSSRVVVVDTISYKSNGFICQRTLPEVEIYTLTIDGVDGQVRFMFDHDIVLTGSRTDFEAAKLTGSPLTDEWRSFEREVDEPFQDKLLDLFAERRAAGRDTAARARVNEAIRQLRASKTQTVNQRIREHPDSMLSLFLLNWYWNDMPKADAQALFAGLAPPLKSHSIAGRLKQQLAAVQEARQN